MAPQKCKAAVPPPSKRATTPQEHFKKQCTVKKRRATNPERTPEEMAEAIRSEALEYAGKGVVPY